MNTPTVEFALNEAVSSPCSQGASGGRAVEMMCQPL